MNNSIKKKPGRPLREAGEEPTIDKIFQAAVDLFAEQGFEATSIRQLALSVGISEAAVYRHYCGKRAILDAIFSYAGERIFSPLEEDLAGHARKSVFRRLLAPLPEAIARDPYVVKIGRIMYLEMLKDKSIKAYYTKEYLQKADDFMDTFFARSAAQGHLIDCNTRTLSRVFNSFRTEWAFRHYIVEYPNQPSTEAATADLEDIISFFEAHFIPDTAVDHSSGALL